MDETTPFTPYQIQRVLGVAPDGRWGPTTEAAARAFLGHPKDNTGRPWGRKRLVLGVQQKLMADAGLKVTIDGLPGQETFTAFQLWRDRAAVPASDHNDPALDTLAPIRAGMDFGLFDFITGWFRRPEPKDPAPVVIEPAVADERAVLQPSVFPRQPGVPSFYGKMGTNQVLVTCPWQLQLAWDKSTKLRKFSLHKQCAASAERAMKAIFSHYGPDGILELGVHRFGGSLNVRRMRGSAAWSMHSWGIAIDWDPEANALNWDHTKARLAWPDAEHFWKCWEREGWTSLGRERDFDWMHVQAARL